MNKLPREVSDAFWNLVEPLVPHSGRNNEKHYTRARGGGRKPLDARTVFAAIVYVLRTGVPWKALPKEKYGSPSSIHRYFREWEKKGFFQELWRKRLSEWDEMEGIAWEWRSPDDGANKTSSGKEHLTEAREPGAPPPGRIWRPVTGRRHQRPRT